jgi:hypothetical protein
MVVKENNGIESSGLLEEEEEEEEKKKAQFVNTWFPSKPK